MSALPYWNQEGFSGLRELAESLRTDARLEALAKYCELRERGLRQEALRALAEFVEWARMVSEPERRELAVHIMDAHWRSPRAHQLLSEPLRKGLIEPVLSDWCRAEPANVVPLRHLALLTRRPDSLAQAISLDATDDPVRCALIGVRLGEVQSAVHHLAESQFLGREADAVNALAEAADLLRSAPDPTKVAELAREHTELAGLLADWSEYQKDPEGPFPAWCLSRGRHHTWTQTVYYE